MPKVGRIIKKIRILLFLIGTLAICSFAYALPQKIKIGLALPLSGNLQFQGDFTRKGIDLYLEQHPSFAEKVELITEDVTSNTTQGVSAVKKLLEIDRVNLMVLEVSPVANAAAPLIERAKVPTLAIIGADAVKAWKYIIKLWLPAKNEAQAVANYIAERNLDRVAVLTSEQDSMLARTAALREALRPGFIFYSVNVSSSEEIPTFAQNIMRSSPKVVVANLMPGLTAVLARKLRELGYKGEIVGSVIISDRAEVEAAQGTLSGAAYPDVALPADFVASYQEKFLEYPGLGVANGYDSMKLFDQALTSTDFKFETELVNQALRVKDFSGALGTYSFLTDGSNAMDLQAKIFTVRNY